MVIHKKLLQNQAEEKKNPCTKKNTTSTLLSESVHFFPYLSRDMLQAVHLPLDYLGKSQQLAQSFNCSSVLLIPKSFRMQSAHPYSKPCGLQAPEPSNLFTSRLEFFFILLFKEKSPSSIPSILQHTAMPQSPTKNSWNVRTLTAD